MKFRALLFILPALLIGSALADPGKAPADDMMIFLLIGQSNMAGRGTVEAQDQVPHPRVFMLSKELAWVPAIDPLHFDKPVAGVGLGKTFGSVIADTLPGRTIGLVPAAVGATSLEQWKPGGELYSNAVARAKEAMKHGQLAGILWHQGEADSGKPRADTYAARFTEFARTLRQDLGAEQIPIIVGETGHFRPKGEAINAVLRALPRTVPLCVAVTAEGLVDRGDHTHFDSASQRELGRRYAQAWLTLANLKPTPPAMPTVAH